MTERTRRTTRGISGMTMARMTVRRLAFESETSAMASRMALSPAMTAAGSPPVRRSKRKTKTATTVRTGMVARRRRAMYPSMTPGAGRKSRRLAVMPEEAIAQGEGVGKLATP